MGNFSLVIFFFVSRDAILNDIWTIENEEFFVGYFFFFGGGRFLGWFLGD